MGSQSSCSPRGRSTLLAFASFLSLGAAAALTFAASSAEAETYGTPGTTSYTVPAGVQYLSVSVSGAGGGGGGSDNNGAGGNGGNGELRTGVIPVTTGQVFTVVVGSGGVGATIGGCLAGGAAGAGENAGGVGGTSGCVGASGAGAGGGGSSALLLAGAVVVEAGGGGGGQGGAQNVAGLAGGAGGAGTGGTIIGGTGGNGVAEGNTDGGGGGAGGGGTVGGAGGTGHADNNFMGLPSYGGTGSFALNVTSTVSTAGGGASGGTGAPATTTNPGPTANTGANGVIVITELQCQTATDCNDNNVCTTDACTANVCSNTPIAADTTCPGGGGVCNGSATAPACVQCLSNANCGGGTPICDTTTDTCRACAVATEATDCPGGACNAVTGACVASSVVLTFPTANGTSDTTSTEPTITGTGVAGQTVTVSIAGTQACTATVGILGTWSCTPTVAQPLGSDTVVATSDGATSTGTLFIACTLNAQCSSGQICNNVTGSCTTPNCKANYDSGSSADCTAATPICTNAGTLAATCTACATGTVYDDAPASLTCVAPAVALTFPTAGGTSTTTDTTVAITGTGVPGQSVTVTTGTTTVCVAVVASTGTWTCTPTAALPLGSDPITATSDGVTSKGTLVVECTASTQCSGATPVCNTTSGACVGCLTDTQCTTGNYCNTKTSSCSPTLANGQTCTANDQCTSGICTNDVCVAPAVDAGVDASTDAAPDAAVDASTDAANDAVNDVTVDAGTDAKVTADAGKDAGPKANRGYGDSGVELSGDGVASCSTSAPGTTGKTTGVLAFVGLGAVGLVRRRKRAS